MMNIKEEAGAILPDIIRWRRHLHQIPETGFALENTISFVEGVLSELGVSYERRQGGSCGLVADINGTKSGKKIALRADMDALPITEETNLPFASKNGNMHACGHDAHTAILLGAAKLLQTHKNHLKGSVRLIFQPAEELGIGSEKMIGDGVLNDVDEILGMHVGSLTGNANIGQLLFKPGIAMSCMDRFKIEIKGLGAHGSMPEKSIDPVMIGAHIVIALQSIISREISPQEPAVISICKFQAGTAFNAIPNCAYLEGTVRAFSNEMREYLKDRIGQIAESTAKAHRAEIRYKFMMQPPPLVNDINITDKLVKVAQKLYPNNVEIMKSPIMGGEDFSRFLEIVPGSFFFLHCPMDIDGIKYGHHNSKFALDEIVFDRGAAVMVQYILE